MEVLCYFCKEKVDKKIAVRQNNKNFHPACLEIYNEKKDCCEYICGIFGIKTPGPKIYSQLSNYTSKNNYSYSNIKKALQYWYEVKKGSRNKANEGIGIVPIIYDEAMQYYANLEEKIKKQGKEINKFLEKEKNAAHLEISSISGKPRETKGYNLY